MTPISKVPPLGNGGMNGRGMPHHAIGKSFIIRPGNISIQLIHPKGAIKGGIHQRFIVNVGDIPPFHIYHVNIESQAAPQDTSQKPEALKATEKPTRLSYVISQHPLSDLIRDIDAPRIEIPEMKWIKIVPSKTSFDLGIVPPNKKDKPVFSVYRKGDLFWLTSEDNEIKVWIGEDIPTDSKPKKNSTIQEAVTPEINANERRELEIIARNNADSLLPAKGSEDKLRFFATVRSYEKNIEVGEASIPVPAFMNSNGEIVGVGEIERQSEETKALINEGKLVKLDIYVKLRPGHMQNFSLLFKEEATPSEKQEKARKATEEELNRRKSPFIAQDK